jgi:hypothetical protein
MCCPVKLSWRCSGLSFFLLHNTCRRAEPTLWSLSSSLSALDVVEIQFLHRACAWLREVSTSTSSRTDMDDDDDVVDVMSLSALDVVETKYLRRLAHVPHGRSLLQPRRQAEVRGGQGLCSAQL